MTGSLADRSILVTGAGRGLGRGVALACAAAGADIVVASPGENGAETVAEIEAHGGSGGWARCDATVAADVEGAVAAAVRRNGHLDVVIHNATSRRSSEPVRLDDVDEALWDEHASVSLRGAYHCAQAALQQLRARRGRFILMTSPAGIEGSAMLPVYGTVKGALRGFAKSLAREWAPFGVTVNAVSPLAETPAMTSAYEKDPTLEARLARVVPMGHLGDPETEIGPAIVFLAGDGAGFITGQTLAVDGGRFTTL
ncbi:MAG TPA: SDR family NAD(P)-dependent oxidoreductase [Acidimicrobiia bacterium]|nr:SDR family NAD(P)-dependent oxidoreductase [Acidimicrobiia bacterium]